MAIKLICISQNFNERRAREAQSDWQSLVRSGARCDSQRCAQALDGGCEASLLVQPRRSFATTEGLLVY
jgi:hypothetical protein